MIPPNERWQVLHSWDGGGAFTGWYVNLESEKLRDRLGVRSVDWHLDLLISPDFLMTWKDEDEAASAVRTVVLGQQYVAVTDRQSDDDVPDGRHRSTLPAHPRSR